MTKKEILIIFGTIVGVMVGLVAGWLSLFPFYLITSPISVPLTLFLMSDMLSEPWSRAQEPTAIIIGIVSWALIILGGIVGGWMGWRWSKGQPVRILKDLKTKKFLLVIIVLAVPGLIVIGLNFIPRLATLLPAIQPTPATKQVTIATDKIEYKLGETVRITVRNGLDKSVWYFRACGETRFWGFNRLEKDGWEGMTRFFLPDLIEEEREGLRIYREVCDPKLCERPTPIELELNSEINHNWQLGSICEWPESPIGFPKVEPKSTKEGTYRVSFTYGLGKEDFDLLEANTIYSNEFRIKESLLRNSRAECLGTCKCMKECNKEGPLYFIPTEEGFSECSVNSDNKICCCSGV